MSAGRILTTHVGSLVRPDDLLVFLRKQQDGEPYDTAAFEECLKRSVADVVRKQAEAGIDIVSDGEYGKTISWSRYILDRLERLRGARTTPSPGFRSAVAGKDRRDFAEFYDEYEANYGFVGMGKAFKTGTWVVTGPIKYTGQAAIRRDIDDLKKAIAGIAVVTPSCRSWRRRASCRSARTNTTSRRRRRCSPSPTHCARNTRRSSMPA